MSGRDPRFPRACDAQLARAMRPMTLIVGAMLVPCGLAAMFLLPAPASWIVGPYDALIGVLFLVLHARLRREDVRPGLAHGVAFAMGAGLAASSVIGVQLVGELALANALLLLIVGAGAFLLSWPWFAAVAAVTVAGWAYAAIPLRDDPSFLLDAILLALALGLGALSHASRLSAMRKLLESRWAAEDAEARLRGVLEAAPVAFLSLDAEGRVSLVAGSGIEARGWSPTAMLGRAAHDVLAQDADAAAQALAGAPVSTSSESGQRTFETRWVPILDEGHAPRGALAVSVDVTERRRAEEERRLVEERERDIVRLQEMDRFKTRILNTASHELNTPLTPIKLQLHMLKLDAKAMDERQRSAVQVLDRNFERLSTLVSDIMDVARLQENRLRMTPVPLDLAPVAQEATLSFEPAARAKGIDLRFEASGAVPATADARRILQVLFNLLSNALKFTPEGGSVTVRARSGEDGSSLVEVIDTGAGLDAAQIAQLFQPFSQVHDVTRSQAGGTGLGLYISRGIVESHGGTLTAASAGHGRGSTFTMRLPAAAAP